MLKLTTMNSLITILATDKIKLNNLFDSLVFCLIHSILRLFEIVWLFFLIFIQFWRR